MPQYINIQPFDVHLTGPNGEKIRIRKSQIVRLPEYYNRYVTKGILKCLDNKSANIPLNKNVIRHPKILNKQPVKTVSVRNDKFRGSSRRTIDSAELDAVLSNNSYSISNGIGVGILSFNRMSSLKRLIDSIIDYTDLTATTVFISDDASTCRDLDSYLNGLPKSFVVLRNEINLGIAGNSNRLLKCLSRFKHKLILNDDVEVLSQGWEKFYFDTMEKTGFHHFCYRQPGVYGATLGEATPVCGINLLKTEDKPHGAVLAIDHTAFSKVGYFDEKFGKYGREHVDWSRRVWIAGLQQPGYFDVHNSNKYFFIHNEATSIESKSAHIQAAKSVQFNDDVYINHSDIVTVDTIGCVIPFRELSRIQAIDTVINGVIAQKFPNIEIIVVEEDASMKLDLVETVKHRFIRSKKPFNKSAAFNDGVSEISSDSVILHDADMLAPDNYFRAVYDILKVHTACHLSNKVYYLDQSSTDFVNNFRSLSSGNLSCNRRVDYFEGGSIACRTKTYWNVGGFVEEYIGYGCFAAGNKVTTSHGQVNIEDVEDGQMVLTHTGEYMAASPRARHYSGNVLSIMVNNNNSICGVTYDHPFLVAMKDKQVWTRAYDLEVGDILVGEPNRKITNINRSYHHGMVYNLEVEKDRSYCVNNVFVHNCEDTDFYARLSSVAGWLEDRRFQLIHLEHPRNTGWTEHHNANKELETFLSSLPASERINRQLENLRVTKYERFI